MTVDLPAFLAVNSSSRMAMKILVRLTPVARLRRPGCKIIGEAKRCSDP